MMLQHGICSCRTYSGCAVNLLILLPIGALAETDLDPTDLSIKLYLNGQLKQNGRTSDMVYNPYEILSYISQSMTLDAGDLILTGTPMGCGPMLPGDEVVVEIEGIGKLRNEVVKDTEINKKDAAASFIV